MIKHKIKNLSISWGTYFLMGVVGLIIVGTMVYSYNKAVRMNTLYAPLIYSSVEVELNVTMAHLLVEEILNGDEFEENLVWEHYAQAEWYANAILQGGENKETIILPLKSKEMRTIVKDLIRRLSEFKKISKIRLSQRETSGPGTEIDKKYNRIFAVFLKEAKEVKRNLQKVMAEDLNRFRFTQFALITTGIILALFVVITLYKLEKLRAKDFQNLKKTNEILENEIQERLRTDQDLRNSRESLRKLSNQLQSIREDEKTRIAREVHDELGQMLTGLKMELSCLENDLKEDPGCLHEKILSMKELTETTINSVRRIATELRPQILDVLGLAEAIEWQAKDYQQRTGIQCNVNIPNKEVKLDKNLKTSIFRIFQEALTNVARHAKANKIEVLLQIDSENLNLKIMDNGVGIEKYQYPNYESLGLLGIEERVNYWKGKFNINGKSQEGTTLHVSIPLKNYEPIFRKIH